MNSPNRSFSNIDECSNLIPKSWFFQDYSLSHSSMVYILLIISSIFQLLGFFVADFFMNYNQIHPSYPVIQDPYFELINWGVIFFLFILQIFALHINSNEIIPLISENFKFLNITISILCTFFYISRAAYDTKFSWILNSTILIILCLLCFYAYIIVESKSNWNSRIAYLGFYMTYSLLLPLIFIELISALMRTISFAGHNATSNEEKVIIFITVLFIGGFVILISKKKIFISASVLFYLFGIFSVQKREVCVKFNYYCSETVQYLCIIYGFSLGFAIGIVFYCLRKSNIKRIESEGTIN